jgi:hypothetical protein
VDNKRIGVQSMATENNQDLDFQLKQETLKFIKKQIDEQKTSKKDNSSIYLESNTLNMLIIYLLMQRENQHNDRTTTTQEKDTYSDEIIKELDSLIADSKTGFEQILSLLKKN